MSMAVVPDAWLFKTLSPLKTGKTGWT